MQRRDALARLCWGVVLALTAGCTDGRPPPVFPVEGILIVGGKPAARAQLAFHAVDQRIVSRPVAITEPDGSFRLMTHAVADGAPAGDYVVTIFWRDESHSEDECEHHDPLLHDRFRGFYVDSTRSPLRASVRPGPNEIILQALDPDDLPASDSPAQSPERKRAMANALPFSAWADDDDE